MRFLRWVLPLLMLMLMLMLGCAPASDTAKKVFILPPGGVRFDFTDHFAEVCPAPAEVACPGATRMIVAGAHGVAMEPDGDGVKVGLVLEAWNQTLTCDVFGCLRIWQKVNVPTCYSVHGSTVAPAMNCPAGTGLENNPLGWAMNDQDPASFKQNLSRSFFGVDNANAIFKTDGKGAGLNDGLWWGDVGVDLPSFKEYWGLETTAAVTQPFAVLTKKGVSGDGSFRLLLPVPDGVKLETQLMEMSTDGSRVFWADRADEVYAITANDNQVLGRRVRKAFSAPVTRTIGVLETDASTFSVAIVDSTTTLGGLGAGQVFEVVLIKSDRLKESPAPLLPFTPLWANTPDLRSVTVCFSEPLDDAQLAVSQFSVEPELPLLSVSNAGIAQCARFQTGLQSRSQRYRLTATGVRGRSGGIAKTASVSFTPDDTPTTQTIDLRTFNLFGARGGYPLADGSAIVSSGSEFGRVDASGVTYLKLSMTQRPAPAVGLSVTVVADESAHGLWTNWSTSSSVGYLALQEIDGTETVWSQSELPSAVLANSGVVKPVGDGSVLLLGSNNDMVRVKKGAAPESISAVSYTNFRGVEPGSHDVLYLSGGRIHRLALPSTDKPQTYVDPSGSANSQGACETQSTLYLCANGRLFTLGDTMSPDVGLCQGISRAPDGVCYAWAFDNLGRQAVSTLRGSTITTKTILNPLKPTEALYGPQFIGDVVLLNQSTLRTTRATWASLVGGTP